jgi:hypothetical protein
MLGSYLSDQFQYAAAKAAVVTMTFARRSGNDKFRFRTCLDIAFMKQQDPW